MAKKEDVIIRIPKEIADKMEKRMKGTNFKSLSEYSAYILQAVLSNVEGPEDKSEETMSDNEKKQVKDRMKRLESLGYLD